MQLLLSRDLWRVQVWQCLVSRCNNFTNKHSHATLSTDVINKLFFFEWVEGGHAWPSVDRSWTFKLPQKFLVYIRAWKVLHVYTCLKCWWLDVTSKCAFWFINCLCLCMHTNHEYFAEIPALPPLQHDPESSEHSEQDSEWAESTKELKFKRTSGPRTHDPYASDDSWFMPITVAVAVFLPVLFCLCRVRWIITSFFFLDV